MRPTLKTVAPYQWSMKLAILGKCWTILGSQIYSEDTPQFWFKNSVWRQGPLSASFWQKRIRKWTKSWRQGFHRAGRGWWGNSGWYLCLCVFVYSCSCIVVYFCICICIYLQILFGGKTLFQLDEGGEETQVGVDCASRLHLREVLLKSGNFVSSQLSMQRGWWWRRWRWWWP